MIAVAKRMVAIPRVAPRKTERSSPSRACPMTKSWLLSPSSASATRVIAERKGLLMGVSSCNSSTFSSPSTASLRESIPRIMKTIPETIGMRSESMKPERSIAAINPSTVVKTIPMVAPKATVKGFLDLVIIERATSWVLSPNSAMSIIRYVVMKVPRTIIVCSNARLQKQQVRIPNFGHGAT